WRDRIDGDPAPPFLENGHPANGKVFIANGTFVEGTRSDVAAIYTTTPFRQRAGWGYLLLTWGFPNSNGTFTLTAIAWDKEGKHTILGTKTITVNNATSTKPFGSIDVPAYGATFSGHNFTFGWALTPVSGCSVAGGTKTMTIDSVPANVVTPYGITYGANRTDIAGAFPGFADSNGAGGAAALDSRLYANGTYQIGWLVYDSCNNGEGIGSRFFQILNGSTGDVAAFRAADAAAKRGGPANAVVGSGPQFRLVGADATMTMKPDAGTPLWLVRGLAHPARRVATGSTVWLGQTGRIEVHATAPDGAPGSDETFEAYLDHYGTLRPLPLGSSFDRTRGVFSWQPVAGFLGEYPLRIVRLRGGVADAQWTARIVVSPGVDETVLQLDYPTDVGRCATSCALSTREPIEIAGWALDPRATDGTGIGHVHAWAVRRDDGATTFLGAAGLGLVRQDVAAGYGSQFASSGYTLTAGPLAPGIWDLTVYAWSLESGRWDAARTVTLVVR
ncbi:MAG: hypothetical protein IT185_09490, partial [Acidobacteria bacterium]|nr:hypothetical protein [Acidobacteriota bacterium]